MNTLTKIVCKTAGAAGIGAVLYDAYTIGKSSSRKRAFALTANHLEKAYANSRTLDNVSNVRNSLQKNVQDWRMTNPIHPLIGKIAGFIKGSLTSLGNNLIPVCFASMALAAKGFMAKAGALGLAVYGALMIARDGFGLGKQTPMD